MHPLVLSLLIAACLRAILRPIHRRGLAAMDRAVSRLDCFPAVVAYDAHGFSVWLPTAK